MSLLHTAAAPLGASVPKRATLFGLSAVAGGLAGLAWSVDLTNWAYYGFLQGFLDPRAPIASLAVGVALAYLVGLIHVTTVCYFPAALASLPLVQAARDKRDWLKMALALTGGMVVVTALFGAIVGGAGGAFAGLGASSRPMSLVMKPVLIVMGLLMLIVALGEFGLVRRLLPELHPAQSLQESSPNPGTGSPYRRAAVLGVLNAATFGVICTRPTYLTLLAYIAVVGSIGYGVVALAAYGVGLASPIALGGFGLLPAGRSTRFLAWLEARREAIHVVQGILLAFLGTLTVAFFWVRYAVPAA
jgi:cytochrome c biogenesis protein CcdA